MPAQCSLCKKTGAKGFFRFPNDPRRKVILELCELPANTSVEHLRICFRHYSRSDLTFLGKNLKPSKGKNNLRESN